MKIKIKYRDNTTYDIMSGDWFVGKKLLVKDDDGYTNKVYTAYKYDPHTERLYFDGTGGGSLDLNDLKRYLKEGYDNGAYIVKWYVL